MQIHRYLATSAVVALATSGSAALACDRWEELAPLLTPRQEVGVAATDDGVIYVIGGILANRTTTGAVERFDTRLGRWQIVDPLPGDFRVHHVGAAGLGRKIYAIGGLDSNFRGVDAVFEYDPGVEEWRPVEPLPDRRGACGVAVLDGAIYVAGGQNGGTSLSSFARYLPVPEDRWEDLPPLPSSRNHLAAASANGVVLAIAGRAGGLFDAVHAFEPTTNRWSERAPIPTARAGIAAAALGELVFVFGGEGNSRDPRGIFPEVEVYDAIHDVWRSRPEMRVPRHGIGAAVVGGRIFLPGGSPVQGFAVTDAHDAFEARIRFGESGFVGICSFVRGDANRDGRLDLSDAVRILLALFADGAELSCLDAADVNDDEVLSITDAIALFDFLFRRGDAPLPPGVVAGDDPDGDALDCAS